MKTNSKYRRSLNGFLEAKMPKIKAWLLAKQRAIAAYLNKKAAGLPPRSLKLLLITGFLLFAAANACILYKGIKGSKTASPHLHKTSPLTKK